MIAAAVIVVAGIAAAAFFLLGDDDDEKTASGGPRSILLLPAAGAGPNPLLSTGFAGDVNTDLAKPASGEGAASPKGSIVVAAETGDSRSFYAGRPADGPCDSPALVAALEADPAASAALVGALGQESLGSDAVLSADNLGDEILRMTPATLQKDVRLGYGSWEGGTLTNRAAVLQRGTDVLIDVLGVPRLRCGSGNPLLSARAVQGKPSFEGASWPDLDLGQLVSISPAATAQTAFEMIDLSTGSSFVRPAGGAKVPTKVLRHAGGSFEITIADRGWSEMADGTSKFRDSPVIRIAPDVDAYRNGGAVGYSIVDLGSAPLEEFLSDDVVAGSDGCRPTATEPFTSGTLTGFTRSLGPCAATADVGALELVQASYAVALADGTAVGIVVSGDATADALQAAASFHRP